jgi:hypothetical protein
LDGTDPEYDTKISKALGAGFYHKAALIVDGDIYKTYHGHHTAGISPDSCLVGMEWEWVICLTFSSSGVQYLRMVTAVDPEWLMVFLPLLFTLHMFCASVHSCRTASSSVTKTSLGTGTENTATPRSRNLSIAHELL